MTKYLIAYFSTAIVFLVIDFIWLGYVAKGIYAEGIGQYLRETPQMGAAVAFYLLYVIGIVFFAISPALDAGSAVKALAYGALFGFFAYATYDVTNYATIKDWPLKMSIIDTVWGTALTGTSAWAGYMITQMLSKTS